MGVEVSESVMGTLVTVTSPEGWAIFEALYQRGVRPTEPIQRVVQEMAEEIGYLRQQLADLRSQSPGGAGLIAQERTRQIEEEGFTPDRDAGYVDRQLAFAALGYLEAATHGPSFSPPPTWPWSPAWWRPGNQLGSLVKAGALIAAEIDRLQRAEGA